MELADAPALEYFVTLRPYGVIDECPLLKAAVGKAHTYRYMEVLPSKHTHC